MIFTEFARESLLIYQNMYHLTCIKYECKIFTKPINHFNSKF